MRELLRKNIAGLVPYSCARNDFKGTASVFLDANENWQDFVKQPGRNRYPDPLSTRLRAEIEKRMGLKAAHTVIGNGSDEVIDNLVRMFCVPGKDHVLLLPPTYGAYRVFCDINDVKVDVVPLTADFQLDMQAILAYLRNEKQNRKEGAGRLKLLFICSPNNPTANAFPLDQVEEIARNFDGITIVDEAYHDFSSVESAVSLQPRYPNLVVLRTLSKCWALAGARIGILVASEEICAVMASIGGVIFCSRIGFVTPMSGNGYEMKAIAACVLGGISLAGGVGSVIGSAIGAVIMSSISYLLVFMGFSSNYDNAITGIILLVIVVIDAVIQHRSLVKNKHDRLLARVSQDAPASSVQAEKGGEA